MKEMRGDCGQVQIDLGDLVAAVDLVAYINKYCELEERRDGCFWGLSPFKEEQTPSFNIDPGKQLYYDFATGKGGDALQFAKDFHGVGMAQAVQLLKEYAHITDGSPTMRLDAAKIAKRYRQRQPARSAVMPGVLPADYMDAMYEKAPDKLSSWLAEGIGAQSMERFLVRSDSVSNRLVFPVRDMSGSIINVCGRTLDEDFKAKRIPKYIYMRSIGAMPTIFGFADNEEFIRAENQLILFEGSKSVMLADTWGIRNTGALLTSHLSEWQMRELIRLQIPVVFALDKEIVPWADKRISRLCKYITAEAIVDTDDLLQPKMAPVDAGAATFQTLYQSRVRMEGK
jgi:DNA primase